MYGELIEKYVQLFKSSHFKGISLSDISVGYMVGRQGYYLVDMNFETFRFERLYLSGICKTCIAVRFE